MASLERVRANINGGCGTPRLVAADELLALGVPGLPYLRSAFADRDGEVGDVAILAALALGDASADAWCALEPAHWSRWPCAHLADLHAEQARAAAAFTAGGRWSAGNAVLTLDARGRGELRVGKRRQVVSGVRIDGARAELAGASPMVLRLGAEGGVTVLTGTPHRWLKARKP